MLCFVWDDDTRRAFAKTGSGQALQTLQKPYDTFTQDTCSLLFAPVAPISLLLLFFSLLLLYIAVQVGGLANVCSEALCVQRASECCKKVHPCGHPCGGVAGAKSGIFF
jgi:hypothetical protein